MRARALSKSYSNRSQLLQYTCHITQALLTIMLFSAIAALLGGCSKRYTDLPAFSALPFRDYENQSVGRFKSSYLVDQIDNFYRGQNPGPIGITTFVNLDDLYTTSSFGRMYAEQVMSELTMRGYDVVELRQADALQFLGNGGEFGLSRDVGMIKRQRDLGAVVVGTYVVSPVRVYVNARLVDPATSLVLSAGSVEMDKTTEMVKLLRGGGLPPSLERIPVKHLGSSTYPLSMFPSGEAAFSEADDWNPGASQKIAPQLRSGDKK